MISSDPQTTRTYDTNNYVSFCNIRLNPKEVNKVIKNNNGLKNASDIENALLANDYISVVKAVWAERDRTTRLQWLREKEPFLHAPLMYELGMAEFATKPTIETINHITFPLFKAAGFRTAQDAVCVDDPLANKCEQALEFIYSQALDALAQKKLHKGVLEILDRDEDARKTAIINKVKETASRSLQLTSFPNPKWVAYSRTQESLEPIKMHPEDRWPVLRSEFANSALQQLQQ